MVGAGVLFRGGRLMSGFVVRPTDEVPLTLQIVRGGGGVGDLTGPDAPLVRMREARTTNSYLDFTDHVFRTSGHVEREAVLLPSGSPGYYHRLLDLSLIAGADESVYVVEFSAGGGSAHDVFVVSESLSERLSGIADDASLVRKAITNRQEEYPGTPGRIVLFDDDGLTKIVEQELRDTAGGGIAAAAAVPARRGGNTL